MIKYRLRCAAGHEYDAWFGGSAAFEQLSASGHLMCEVCGSAEISRAPMAPAVARSDRSKPRRGEAGGQVGGAPIPTVAALSGELPDPQTGPQTGPPTGSRTGSLADPSSEPSWSNQREIRARLKALREEILAKSEYVGPRFAEEARVIHEQIGAGEPPRAIHGEATPDEVRSLVEDGVPVAPIPKLPDDAN